MITLSIRIATYRAYQTDLGIKYIVMKKGDGVYPSEGDYVAIDYNAFLNNGTLFDTTIGKGKKSLSFRFGKEVTT